MSLSLNPTDAEERPLDNRERVTVMEAFVESTDYGGRIDNKVPVMTIVFRTKSGLKRERSYSAGSGEHVQPNADGTGFDAVGDSKGLPAGCNTVAFLQSLVAAGFPASELAQGDVTCIVGLELVIMEVDQPQRFAPRSKPKLVNGQPVKDAQGKVVMEPPPPPKRYWLVSEIVGLDQPGLPIAPPPPPSSRRGKSVPPPELPVTPVDEPFKHPDVVPPAPGTRAIDDDDIPF
jgi:hypothetical protein